MTDITIPPEALEAVAEAICDAEFWPGTWATLDKESNEVVVYRKQARAACLAMLRAWPQAGIDRHWMGAHPKAIILPLTQENTDAE